MIKDLCFEIIETCPNNCMFCSSVSSMCKTRIIEYDIFEKTVLYLQEKFGIKELSLSGGEPFLHPDILKMISLCSSLGIRTVLFTSGVTKQNLHGNIYGTESKRFNNTDFSSISRDVLKKCKELGLSKIVFDFQATEEDDYNKLMGTTNYFAFVLKSMCDAKFEGLDVDVHFIPNKINYKSLPDLLECLDIIEIPQVSLLNFVPQGRGKQNASELSLSIEEMNEFIKIYKNCLGKYNVDIRVGIPLDSNNMHRCTAGMGKFDIKFDGTVLPCPAFKETKLSELCDYGVKDINIYRNINELTIYEGTRREPLCKKIYGIK